MDQSALEAGLKVLWEKARQAGDTIAHLREERTALRGRVDDLEARVAELEAQLARRPAEEAGIVGNGEREAVAAKLKDLLARLEAYL